MAVPDRCAAHPSRPAVDRCPTCERPRCGADRAAHGQACTLCATVARAVVDARIPLLKAALAAYAVAILMGYVVAQYVQAEVFAYLAPLVLGLLCGFAATSAAGNPKAGMLARRIRSLCVVYSVLGTAFGFVLEGTFGALSTSPDVLVPYLLAAAASAAWTTPPKARKPSSPSGDRPGG